MKNYELSSIEAKNNQDYIEMNLYYHFSKILDFRRLSKTNQILVLKNAYDFKRRTNQLPTIDEMNKMISSYMS